MRNGCRPYPDTSTVIRPACGAPSRERRGTRYTTRRPGASGPCRPRPPPKVHSHTIWFSSGARPLSPPTTGGPTETQNAGQNIGDVRDEVETRASSSRSKGRSSTDLSKNCSIRRSRDRPQQGASHLISTTPGEVRSLRPRYPSREGSHGCWIPRPGRPPRRGMNCFRDRS
jgi:hypothetical protein